MSFHFICQHPGNLGPIRAAIPFHNLIADAPDHNAGMIAIALDHRLDIALPPFIKSDMVIEWIFPFAPAVESFVHYQHAQPVAGVQESRGGRVMRGADGIVTIGLMDFHFAFISAGIGRCA
jgi:hypothetical protein